MGGVEVGLLGVDAVAQSSFTPADLELAQGAFHGVASYAVAHAGALGVAYNTVPALSASSPGMNTLQM